MKYKDKYPNMIQIYDEIDGIIKGKNEGKCHMCDDQTHYVNIHFEVRFCSEECLTNLENEYNRWLQQDVEE